MTKALSVTVAADGIEELHSLLGQIINGKAGKDTAEPSTALDKVASAAKPKKKSNPFGTAAAEPEEDEESEAEEPVKKPAAKKPVKKAVAPPDDEEEDSEEDETEEEESEVDVADLRKQLLATMNKYHAKNGDEVLPKLGKIFKKFGAAKMTELEDENVSEAFDAIKAFIKKNP